MNAATTVERTFVGLGSPVIGRAGAGGYPCQGIWHTPCGVKPTVDFIASHYNVDFSEQCLAELLAARGYGFLGWNNCFRSTERSFLLDHAVAEIGVGVRWMRDVAGVDTVVLLGNSGGGSLMAAYNWQAAEPNLVSTAGLRPIPGLDDLIAGGLFKPDYYLVWCKHWIDSDDWAASGGDIAPQKAEKHHFQVIRFFVGYFYFIL